MMLIPKSSPPTPFPDEAMDRTYDREQPVVFVAMDGDVGFSISDEVNNLIPFNPRPSKKSYLKKQYRRYSLPLAAASATTNHKAQGITAKNGVVVNPSDVYPMDFHNRSGICWVFAYHFFGIVAFIGVRLA